MLLFLQNLNTRFFFIFAVKMESEFSVPFKAFVKNNDGSDKQEIRYFTVDRGSENNFDYLHAKLVSVFPCLLKKTFKVSWIGKQLFSY